MSLGVFCGSHGSARFVILEGMFHAHILTHYRSFVMYSSYQLKHAVINKITLSRINLNTR